MFSKKKKDAEDDRMSSGARREAEALLAQAQADRELSMDALGGVAGGVAGGRDHDAMRELLSIFPHEVEEKKYLSLTFECPKGDYTGREAVCPNCGARCRPKLYR